MLQKYIFYRNFLTKPLRMMILVFRPMFYVAKEFAGAIHFHQWP